MQRNRVVLIGVIFLFLIGSILPVGTSQAAKKHSAQNKGVELLEISPGGALLQLEIGNFDISSIQEQGFRREKIVVPGSATLEEVGQPELPIYYALVAIPDGVKVRLTILKAEEARISLAGPLLGSRFVIADSSLIEGGRTQRWTGEFLSGGAEIYPKKIARIVEEGWLRDQRFIKVEFAPFQFVYKANALSFHQKIVVRIHFDGETGAQTVNDQHQDDVYRPIYTQTFLNGLSAQTWLRTGGKIPQDGWTVSQEPRVKISVESDGITRVTAADLISLGLQNVNPQTFRLTSQGSVVAYLLENDDGDNQLDANESLIFFGQRFTGDRFAARFAGEDDHWYTYTVQLSDGSYSPWKPTYTPAMFEKVTQTNIYWLSWGGAAGVRMGSYLGAPEGTGVPETFQEQARSEVNQFWRSPPFTSEETWVWERFDASSQTGGQATHSYPFWLEYPSADTSEAVLEGEMIAYTNNGSASPDHHIQLQINGEESLKTDAYWDGQSRYHFSFSFPVSALHHGNNTLAITAFTTPAISSETLFLDWFQVKYARLMRTSTNAIQISTQGGNARDYEVSGFSGVQGRVFDVSDPLLPLLLTGVDQSAQLESSYSIGFKAPAGEKKFLLIDESVILTPTNVSLIQPPVDLDTNGADFVIVSPEAFLSTALEYASFRSGQGISSAVVSIEHLYNEFTDGIRHPLAIKEFLRYLYAERGEIPLYLLLVGDGHWNFLESDYYPNTPQYMLPNLAWVDPWQGEVDSLNLLGNVIGEDPLADLMLGRLPVNSEQEFANYLNKVKSYESSLSGDWRHRHIFITDNTPDSAGNFPALAEEVIHTYLDPAIGEIPLRMYLDNYGQASALEQDIIDTLNNEGAVFVSYIGHGNVQYWAGEGIFKSSDIPALHNGGALPVILSLTCLDGHWTYPGKSSLVEEMVRANNAGAIAGFSPTGLGVATGHDVLHQGFYEAVVQNGNSRLGQASEFAKLHLYEAGYSLDLIQTFMILGDPSLELQSQPFSVFLPNLQNH